MCGLFDPPTELVLRRLWARLEELGINTLQTHTHGLHHPHLSLAVLREWDFAGVSAAVAELPDCGPFALPVHGVVTFPRGRVALAPSATAEVVRRQEQIAMAVTAAGAILHKHYEPGQWVPHCSISPDARGPELAVVAKAVMDVLPLTLYVDRAAFIDSATGEAWAIPTIP